jgi:hypothetical protein
VLESDKIDYKSAGKAPTLEVPPDLSQLSRDNRYAVPGGAVTANAYQAGGQRAGRAHRGHQHRRRAHGARGHAALDRRQPHARPAVGSGEATSGRKAASC